MIVIPRQYLPDDEQARYERLCSYFTEHMASSASVDEGWLITLNWPDTADYYIDPRLMEGLSWWSQDLSLEGIPAAVRTESRLQLSLNDSWTLFSWSRWLAQCSSEGSVPSEIVLLHLDDHDDLMSPRLFLEQGSWIDAISHQPVDLLKPKTICAAIGSGAIGIGSFIVPLLHRIPKVHMRHLCATGYSLSRRGKYLLQRETVADDFLNPDMMRPAKRLEAIQESSDWNIGNTSTYSVSANPDEWLHELPDVPTLLHIDLDYFNNRFNGDSDWESHSSRHDPTSHEITTEIDSVFNTLAERGIFDRIVDITVALSPGFFPVEFWSLATERINYHLDKLG
ncbi:MAG: hypothetical protein ICV55_01525 [Coleofasciculus sp. C3-bin4]|nr:hypothetical protein [Coleofasciculus sp. Co-bin14]MBD0361463.1 hypothetical protein [Coleofasciculus sp. C3-bin4]